MCRCVYIGIYFSFPFCRCSGMRLWVWPSKTSRLTTSVKSERCRSPKTTRCCWREAAAPRRLINVQRRSSSSWKAPRATTRRRNSTRGSPSCPTESLCSRCVSIRRSHGTRWRVPRCFSRKQVVIPFASLSDWRNEWRGGEREEGPRDRRSERHPGGGGGGDRPRWRLRSAALHALSR